MRRKLRYFFMAVVIFSNCATAQTRKDSGAKVLDEVVVTATRTENKVSNIPLPVQVISGKNIQFSGSQKLIDILQMQTGLVIANNPLGTALQGYPNPFGDGIQMQGLDPAYTLILVNGEPLIGRNAGIINLGRISVGNIKQIEIIRGPATCLYGSDALAGVVNIITEEPVKSSLNLQARYATNNTLGLTAAGAIKKKKIALELFINRYSSDGYDLDKNIYGKTIDPFVDYSANAKLTYNISHKNKFTLSARYFSEKQFNNYLIYPQSEPQIVKGTTAETDGSLFARYDHKVNAALNYTASVYTTSYTNNAGVYLKKNDSLYERIQLTDFLLRPEIQFNMGKNPSALFVAGAGYNFETVNSTRYSSWKEMDAWYAFVQKQIQWKGKTNIIMGARFDKNSLYPAQLSPKLAIAYKLKPDFILKGSIGAGFKAPDFRQQFLNFSNSLIGYTILGANELAHGLQTLQNTGQINPDINLDPYMHPYELSPEKSIGLNAGFDYTINSHAVLKVNFFRNDISNLIESYNLPFNKTNNQSIFSYKNLDKVFTEGTEASFSYNFNQNFSLFGGYQYLIAKDKKILQQIKDGKLYKRDPDTYVTTLVTKGEYKGLYNRSRNTANLRFQYNNLTCKANAFITAKYRGTYGFSGLDGFQNGSGVYTDERESVKGFVLLNATVSKRLATRWEVQSGIENILNYKKPLLMPNIYGRTYFINANFKLEKENKMKKKTVKLSVLALAALMTGLISCGKKDNTTPTLKSSVSVTDSIQVPFSSTAPYTLYSFKDSSVVPNSDSATLKWDFGIRFVNIIANSHASGPGNAAVITQPGVFETFASAPETGYAYDTTATQTAIDAGYTTGWYNYDPNDPTHTFHPKAGQFFVFKTADGHYVKMEILSVSYLPFTGQVPVTLVYKFRYTYQADGSRNF